MAKFSAILSHNRHLHSGCSFICVCVQDIKLTIVCFPFHSELASSHLRARSRHENKFPKDWEKQKDRRQWETVPKFVESNGSERIWAVFTRPPVKGSTVHEYNHVTGKLTSDNNHAIFLYVDFFLFSFFYILSYPSGLLFPCCLSLFNNLYRSYTLF
jgi:hypothetical protein